MTTTPRIEPVAREERQEWDADGSTAAFVVRGLILIAIGAFLGGLAGFGVAGVGVVATWKRRAGYVAGASAGLLVAAALATVFEVVPQQGSLRSNFADVRPIASGLGLAAGILAIVAVVTLAFRERAPQPALAVTAPTQPGGVAGLRAQLSDPATQARARRAAPFAAVALATLVVRTIVAPTALTSGLRALAANLRIGAGYVLGAPGAYRPTGALLPVPALLGAFAPGGATFSLVLASVATVVLAMALTRRLAGAQAGLLAGVAVLVVEVATTQRLPSAVAAALLLLAALLGLDQSSVSARSAFAGVALGLAILSEPWAVIAAPALLAWIAWGGRHRRRSGSLGAAALALVAAVVTCTPWLRFVHSRFATWAPASEMPFTLGTVAAFLPLLVVAAAATLRPRFTTR